MKNTFCSYRNYLGEQLSHDFILDKIEKLAFCLTDERGYFLEVNDAYCDLYGYTEAELIGQHFTMVVPEEYRAYASDVHDQFIAGTDEMPAQWTVRNKAGELMQIHAEAIRCQSKEGTTTKMTLIERLDK
jgi:PAS domain S-box-containing protein